MPIHDVGYRKWDGQRTSGLGRFWIITKSGILLAVKSRWVRRMLFFAWLPVMYWGITFFFVEQQINSAKLLPVEAMEKLGSDETLIKEAKRRFRNQRIIDRAEEIDHKNLARILRNRFKMIPKVDQLADGLESGEKATVRHVVWSWLLMTFFRYPQGLLIIFLIGTVAPALISRDLRSRAYLLYFSRPIGKVEYMVGKLLIPVSFIMFVSTFPALALYTFAIMMSPDLSVFANTWDIPIRIMIATIALVLPVSALSLSLSSLTQESRFANFAWFAIWTLGHGAWLAIVFATAIGKQTNPFAPEVMQSEIVKNWSVLSLFNNLGDIQSWIFGFGTFESVWKGIVTLVVLTLISLFVLYRRVSAPTRV